MLLFLQFAFSKDILLKLSLHTSKEIFLYLKKKYFSAFLFKYIIFA